MSGKLTGEKKESKKEKKEKNKKTAGHYPAFSWKDLSDRAWT
jgi:hypothetical protein